MAALGGRESMGGGHTQNGTEIVNRSGSSSPVRSVHNPVFCWLPLLSFLCVQHVTRWGVVWVFTCSHFTGVSLLGEHIAHREEGMDVEVLGYVLPFPSAPYPPLSTLLFTSVFLVISLR